MTVVVDTNAADPFPAPPMTSSGVFGRRSCRTESAARRARVDVTGGTAFPANFNNVLVDNLPAVLAFVLGLSFRLLMLAFRSTVVPLNAIIMNPLSA